MNCIQRIELGFSETEDHASMSKLPDEIRNRLIFDIFREGSVHSAMFYWSASEMEEDNKLIQGIIDSVSVSP